MILIFNELFGFCLILCVLVLIDLSEVQNDYAKTTRGYDLRIIADHYGVFEDLFGAAYFVPRVDLNIQVHISKHISC